MYLATEKVTAIRAEIKEAFPTKSGYKFSIKKDRDSHGIEVRLLSSILNNDLDCKDEGYESINDFYISDHGYNSHTEIVFEVIDAIVEKHAGFNYDRNAQDMGADYPDYPYTKRFSIGSWDKRFVKVQATEEDQQKEVERLQEILDKLNPPKEEAEEIETVNIEDVHATILTGEPLKVVKSPKEAKKAKKSDSVVLTLTYTKPSSKRILTLLKKQFGGVYAKKEKSVEVAFKDLQSLVSELKTFVEEYEWSKDMKAEYSWLHKISLNNHIKAIDKRLEEKSNYTV